MSNKQYMLVKLKIMLSSGLVNLLHKKSTARRLFLTSKLGDDYNFREFLIQFEWLLFSL